MKVLTLIKAKSNVFLWYVQCCSCTRGWKPKYWRLGRRHLGLSLRLWRHNVKLKVLNKSLLSADVIFFSELARWTKKKTFAQQAMQKPSFMKMVYYMSILLVWWNVLSVALDSWDREFDSHRRPWSCIFHSCMVSVESYKIYTPAKYPYRLLLLVWLHSRQGNRAGTSLFCFRYCCARLKSQLYLRLECPTLPWHSTNQTAETVSLQSSLQNR